MTCLACLFWVLWDSPLVNKFAPLACLPVTLSSWLTFPFRAAPAFAAPQHSSIAQLKLRVYIASDSSAGPVRACLGVSACHCSSLSKQASSLRACLGTSNTMVALCKRALTSLPSISKYRDHVLFHFKQCTIFAYYTDDTKKAPKTKRIHFYYSWMNAIIA